MTANADLLTILKSAPRSRYYLCDFHVHSPASPDMRTGDRFRALSDSERTLIEKIPTNIINEPVLYEREAIATFPASKYYDLLVQHRDQVAQMQSISPGEDWAFIAITDHNVCEYSAALSSLAWEQRHETRLLILPGIELEVSFPVENAESASAHILLIFAPASHASDIRVAIRDLTSNSWSFGQIAEVSSIAEFVKGIRSHKDYPAIAIAAHVSSAKGIRGAIKSKQGLLSLTALDAAIARTTAELETNPDADKTALEANLGRLRKEHELSAQSISEKVLSLIGSCGFDALQVSRKQDEIHYRRLHRFHPDFGRAVPVVASDAHCISEIFSCDGNNPYLKLSSLPVTTLSNQVLEGLRFALRYGETRFSYSTPGRVTEWISGIEISPEINEAAQFWPFKSEGGNPKSFLLPLSKNLNCLIGGRGSGKSAALEAIAFITAPEGYLGKYKKRSTELEDWYKRAKATLSGSQVRIVWQTSQKLPDLPKGALFASRYFNPDGELQPVSYTNLQEKEVPLGRITMEQPQLFRSRDIENAAEPDRLRALFDRLVGEQIPKLEQDISSILQDLANNREKLLSVASRIHNLTADGSPLREYCRRKAAYEAANRADVQPLYKNLDDAAASEAIALDTNRKWERAVADFGISENLLKLLSVIDSIPQKIVDQEGKLRPYCEGLVKLFETDAVGPSPRDRLAQSVGDMQHQLAVVGEHISGALSKTQAGHKVARETLLEQGLPPGAKDREAKKSDFEEAKNDYAEYLEASQEWKELFALRKQLFETLVEKCSQRSNLRKATASRISAKLGQDLDPSILVIQMQVHPMEDKSSFRTWLNTNVGPCITKSREPRISAIIEKGAMPSKVRDSLLGETGDGASIFIVEKSKANEGRVEPELAREICQRCTGKSRLDPEHLGMREVPPTDFVAELPIDIREGLWTFPQALGNSERLVADSVLMLDEAIFDDRPEILLNDRPCEPGSALRPIGDLSPGQRCSAILPILLLNGHGPLIIDQPEDNLDNRLIRQVIANIMASIKLCRQVIVATHNPNIPVLGDVEQAVVLRAVEEKQSHLESCGDLDSTPTVAHLTDIMEGGREAFQYRQSIYQSHWKGPMETKQ